MAVGQVAIALPGDAERAREVITRGRRVARQLGLEWIALRITAKREEVSAALTELVSALGGRLVLAESRDAAAALIELTCREEARVLVIGRSRRPRILRRLLRGTTERLLSAARPFDVLVAAEEDVR